jgi:hypothetical protein
MVVEPLIPGMEHGEYTEDHAFSRRNFEDGLRSGGEKGFEGVHSSLPKKERTKRFRNSEDDVKMTER